jgi:hypothetical protein
LIEVHPPVHALTKKTPGRFPAQDLLCAWCGEKAIYADAITWRDLDGELVDVKTFHPHCWGEALRPIQAKMEVAEQLGILPAYAIVPRREP